MITTIKPTMYMMLCMVLYLSDDLSPDDAHSHCFSTVEMLFKFPPD